MNTVFRSLLFWLLVSSGAALVWPAQRVGFDPFVASRWLLWTLITVTMFCLGCLVRPDELQPLRRKPWWVVLGVATQVIVMPISAWLAVQMIPMSTELAAGVILVGCVPGAMASNVLTHTAGGSVAYSVSLTTIATLLSPITVPALLSVFAVEAEASQLAPAKTSLLLLLTVVMPTVVGYAVTRRREMLDRWAQRFGPAIASACLLWIIASVVASNRSELARVQSVLILALLVVNIAGYAAGYSIGRGFGLPFPYRRALTLEVGMQNAGLGTALAATVYGEQTLATIPTAAYTFGCMLTGTMLAVAWKSAAGWATDAGQQAGPNAE